MLTTKKTLSGIFALLLGFLGIVFLLGAQNKWTSAAQKRDDHIGSISSSQPKIWREGQVMPFIGEQLSMVEQMGKSFDADALQGARGRGASTSLEIKGAASLSFPPVLMEGTTHILTAEKSGATLPAQVTVDALKDSANAPAITLKSSSNSLIPEPLDRLARIDDYYGVYEATRLEHLRDSVSMEPGWSMYMLGFNVFIQPGDITRENYQAMTKYAIESMSIDGVAVNKDKLGEKIQVYSVYPQRYTLQYAENMSNIASLLGAAEVSAPVNPATPGTALSFSGAYGKKYMESLEQIQNYPLISGFVNPDNTFGWVFNPRPRIVSQVNSPKIVSSMQEGAYAVTALIMVKDDSRKNPPWIYRISSKDLYGYFNLKEKGDDLIEDQNPTQDFLPATETTKLVLTTAVDLRHKDGPTAADSRKLLPGKPIPSAKSTAQTGSQDVPAIALEQTIQKAGSTNSANNKNNDLLEQLFQQYTDYYVKYANLESKAELNDDGNTSEAKKVNDLKFVIEYNHLIETYNDYISNTPQSLLIVDLSDVADDINAKLINSNTKANRKFSKIVKNPQQLSINYGQSSLECITCCKEENAQRLKKCTPGFSQCKTFCKEENERCPQKCKELAFRKELAKTWKYVHVCALSGEGTREPEINITLGFNPEWRPYNIEHQSPLIKLLEPPYPWKKIYSEEKPGNLKQDLPKATYRALHGISAVTPAAVPGNQENWITIRGQGFGNDLVVMAGSQRATTVEVVGNSLILAKLPKPPAQPKGKTEYQARVQVFTGGEALTACEDCFKYVAPFDEIEDKTAAFSATLKTTEGAPGDCIKIETSQAVKKESLKEITVGATAIPINEITIEDKVITLKAPPAKATDCAGKELKVTLVFNANSKVVAGDKYEIKDATFKLKASTCSNNPANPQAGTTASPQK